MSNYLIKKYGAIDIGSNAIRLLITGVLKVGDVLKFKKVSVIRVPIRLGEDVFSSGTISDEKKTRLLDAMIGFNHLLKAHKIDNYRACATSAMREASNGKELIKSIKKQSSLSIEIISGAEEAKLIFEAGISQTLDQDKTYLYVDVGGGSTEITLFSDHKIVDSNSFKIGTVRLLQNKVKPNEWDKMKIWLEKTINNVKVECLIGSGGNINKLIKLTPAYTKGNKYIQKDELKSVFADLSELTYEERMNAYNLNPDRADVIIPAAKIFLTIIRWSNTNSIYVPKLGLSDGITHHLAEEEIMTL